MRRSRKNSSIQTTFHSVHFWVEECQRTQFHHNIFIWPRKLRAQADRRTWTESENDSELIATIKDNSTSYPSKCYNRLHKLNVPCTRAGVDYKKRRNIKNLSEFKSCHHFKFFKIFVYTVVLFSHVIRTLSDLLKSICTYVMFWSLHS